MSVAKSWQRQARLGFCVARDARKDLVMRLVVSCLILSASVVPAFAQPFSNAKTSLANYTVADSAPQKSCESLAAFKSEGIVSINARTIPAAAATPQHCRVTGVITPEVAFEVNLPDRWNRRFYMTGNGGLAGQALDEPANADRTGALTNGFVHARTNTGHDSQKEPSGSFILSNPQKALDYAYRAVHVTAETAKKIATDYYAKPIMSAYWNSCSNGGRPGLLEAQRYPDDFDGIVANSPWVDQTGFTIGAMWNQKALTEVPISPEKLLLVARKVMDTCDAADGLEDGLIGDPRACRFDAARDVPACSAGTDTPDCLTAAQAATINKIHRGPISQGKPLSMAGYLPGSEAVVTTPAGAANSNWVGSIVAAQPGAKPADLNLAEGVMRYLILDPPQPQYDFMTFDYDRDPALVERWSKLADAKDTDLSRFRRSGGKVIMTYGWADQILQPMMGVTYYEAVVARNGKDTADFARLFMMPGVAHCGGGIGPNLIDAVTAVIDWVEKNKAPDSLLASKVTKGAVERTRPICPYPQVARYTGQGSIDEAANFSCMAPR
jgi:tannase/feruloyl esterase